MPTGYEVEYYHNIKQIVFYLKQISVSLGKIQEGLENK
jgi:hypothetical protein